jgi:general stress protein 26
MNIEEQGTPDLRLIAKLIENMKVAMLTSIEPDGSLTSRPMMPLELDAAGVFWFFTDIRSERLEHLRQLNLAFSDEERSTYLSLSGHGEVDNERSRIEVLWTPEAEAWFPDGPQSNTLALLRFVARNGEYWDAPASRMVRFATMAAAAVSGTPVASGDHGTLSALATSLPPDPPAP